MDAISEILKLSRFKSAVYFKSEFPSGWGMEIPNGPFAQFHIIVSGTCLVGCNDFEKPKALFPGDILLFPHGSSHWLGDDELSSRRPGMEILTEISQGIQPFTNNDATTTIICGHFEYDQEMEHPFLSSLPDVIHIPDYERRRFSWMESICSTIMQETGSSAPGSDLLITKLAETLFIQVLRVFASRGEGFVAALSDQHINQALKLIHSEPAESWTLDSLARSCGISRTLFANKFRQLVGTTPMTYLADWRLMKAKELLKDGNFPVSIVAERVGYNSEVSFNRAFRKKFNLTPGKYKRISLGKAA